jgi:hypothetical protein
VPVACSGTLRSGIAERLLAMRWLEVRRHSFTKKGERQGRGSDLCQQRVSPTGQLGVHIDPAAYVAVSPGRLPGTRFSGAVFKPLRIEDERPLAVTVDRAEHEPSVSRGGRESGPTVMADRWPHLGGK